MADVTRLVQSDLRVNREALVAAAVHLPLYLEPVVLHADDFDPSHLVFINDGLADLKTGYGLW